MTSPALSNNDMKTLLNVALLTMTIDCASAQTEPAHEWKVTLKVVDDTGQPVAGAEAWVNYSTNRFVGFTDTNGIFAASHLDQSVQLAFQVRKPGYYSFAVQYLLGFHYEPTKWEHTEELVLSRMVNPIPMYARNARERVGPRKMTVSRNAPSAPFELPALASDFSYLRPRGVWALEWSIFWQRAAIHNTGPHRQPARVSPQANRPSQLTPLFAGAPPERLTQL